MSETPAPAPVRAGGRNDRSTYRVKELFLTLQGEGINAGRPAVFCRFSGCNLWNGHESSRASATCRFCDTDFVGIDGPGGGAFRGADALAEAVLSTWVTGTGTGNQLRSPHTDDGPIDDGPIDDGPIDDGPASRRATPLVVCTGGEPLLQLDRAAVAALHDRGFEIAIETNGTLPVVDGIDWVCVSPKADADLVVESGDELKLVFPQQRGEPERYQHLRFDHFLLQPMDGPDRADNTRLAIDYCLTHPTWRLSVQTHKYLGIP